MSDDAPRGVGGTHRVAPGMLVKTRGTPRRGPRLALALAAALAMLLAAAPAAPAAFLTKWGGNGHLDGQFSDPSDIATDAAGNVYVADRGNARIQKFTSGGVFLTKWGGRHEGLEGDVFFNELSGIATDAAGNVYAFDGGTYGITYRIQKFTSDGDRITQWGRIGLGSIFKNQYPGSLATDAAGNVYVGDGDSIQKFTSDGAFITKWGEPGDEDGQFRNMGDIATDPAGNVYVAEGSRRIQKFTSAGAFLTKWNGRGAGGIATDAAGSVYGVNGGSRIAKFTSEGTFVGAFGEYVERDGQFRHAYGVATDAAGNVYVLDGNSRVLKFSGETTAPRITAAGAGPKTFAVGKKGTTFGYTISEAARVVFTIEQKQSGRRALYWLMGTLTGRCVAQTRTNRDKSTCTLYKRAGSLVQQGAKGRNTKPFSGKNLKPGIYRATLVATDAAGNPSKAAQVSFNVVRG